MALAKPVVATDVGGIPEAVVNGVTGLLVPPGQPSRLADAILCLIEDRSTRLRMGMAGYARVRQHFTIKAQMGALESLYAELIYGKTRQLGAPQRRCAGP
jgi:glycosyltransferase involved in cell wall biosynthesis